jgi:hypothetical protein
MAALGRHFPHLRVADIFPVLEIDPVSIMGPTREAISMYIDVQLARHTTTRINDIDVGVTSRARIEGDEPPVGRPVR